MPTIEWYIYKLEKLVKIVWMPSEMFEYKGKEGYSIVERNCTTG